MVSLSPVSQRIWTPRSRSADGFGPPFTDLDLRSRIWTPRSRSADGFGPPFTDLDLMVRQQNTRNVCTIVHFLVGVMLRQ